MCVCVCVSACHFIFGYSNTTTITTTTGTARIFTVRTQSEKCRDEWLSDILNAMKIAGKDSCQDKLWGEDFWGERFSWEKKDTQLGNPEMWEIAAKMFSQPPFSNGHDARYTKVKTRLRKLYGRKAINESNKLRLKALALNHGVRLNAGKRSSSFSLTRTNIITHTHTHRSKVFSDLKLWYKNVYVNLF